MFVKHCKVEVYLTELKLCEDSNMDNVITRRFSKADTIGRPESPWSNQSVNSAGDVDLQSCQSFGSSLKNLKHIVTAVFV